MKKLLLLLFIPLFSFGQYSTYYGTYDVNVNANINKNVNVSGNVNKTVTTIDYGALANANALREKNRIESLKVADERDRNAMIAIANDPSKAFDYGTDYNWKMPKKGLSKSGFKKITWYFKIPHKSLFSHTGNGLHFQNISDNYITTEIELYTPMRVSGIRDEKYKKSIQNRFKGIFTSVEEYAKYPEYVVGEYNDSIKSFIHKKDINRTKLWGVNGFKSTLIFEDDYEFKIKDNYYAVEDGILYFAGVRYKGDKDEITFEDLEGRRYYFRKLIDKIISTQRIYDLKF